MSIDMKEGGVSYRQGFYLRRLSDVTGEHVTWDDIDNMTKREASEKIAELLKIVEDRKLKV